MSEDKSDNRMKKVVDWREIVSRDLQYYFDTEEGRKKLDDMVKKESKAILERIAKRPKVDWIIWFSRHCPKCAYFALSQRGGMKCGKHNARIVMPFYGKPNWRVVQDGNEGEYIIDGVDWTKKAIDIPDEMVKEAVNRVNKGFPYFCFKAKNEITRIN